MTKDFTVFYDIFSYCFDVLSTPFYICGIKVSLFAFMVFDILLFIVLWVVCSIFKSR